MCFTLGAALDRTLSIRRSCYQREILTGSLRKTYMSRVPPLNALRCFEAVARLSSVTRAAAELHLTHAAVSQQVKGLEHQLGMVLFERQGRGIEVTGDGRVYAEQV